MVLQSSFAPLVAAVVEACHRVYGPRLRALAVFGSVGRGTARPGSDIDMLLVARDLPRGRMKRNREFEAVENLVAPAIAASADVATRLSVVYRTPEELERTTPILLDMVEDAQLLVDEDGILAARLARLKARLDELGARRIWCGDHWYWDLMPGFRPGDLVEL